jgi:Spy/CpxP family protein refolding chaperone
MATKLIAIAGLLLVACVALASAAPPTAPVSSAPSASGPPVVEPIIDWGKCPQLAPTEEQRKQKTEIIKQCLEANPLAMNEALSAEVVEKHRIKLGECALNKEDWVSVARDRDRPRDIRPADHAD